VECLFGLEGAFDEALQVIVHILEDDILNQFSLVGLGVEEILRRGVFYLDVNDILAIFDQKEYLVLSAELIAYFFDPLQCHLALRATVFRLEDIACMRKEVPKQPEPMMRLML
jgi:hypothetical protein